METVTVITSPTRVARIMEKAFRSRLPKRIAIMGDGDRLGDGRHDLGVGGKLGAGRGLTDILDPVHGGTAGQGAAQQRGGEDPGRG